MPGGRYNTLMFIILRIDPYFYKVRLAFIRNTAHVYVGCHALYPSLGIKVTPNVMPNVIEISDGAQPSKQTDLEIDGQKRQTENRKPLN